MTTIAYRGNQVVGDTLMSSGNQLVGSMVKIAANDHGDVAGACGETGYNGAFLRWFSEGEKGDAPSARTEDNQGTNIGVIFRANGEIVQHEVTGSFSFTAPYYAIGSGSSVALGAMHAGADAHDAVRAAMEHDAYTGGEVFALTLGPR